MSCKHAANALIYAQKMAEMDEPWKLWEYRNYKEWQQCWGHPYWYDDTEYRQIPKTISINGIEVPEPMRDKPEIGTVYYVVDAVEEDGTCERLWADDIWDNWMFNRGQIHLTRENCIIHAKALFSFSEVG